MKDRRPTIAEYEADTAWRDRADQNRRQVTYPSWRPRKHWEDKHGPWTASTQPKAWMPPKQKRGRSQRIW